MSAAEKIAERGWTLRPYQVEALRAISGRWQADRSTLLVLATGLGKTSVFAEVLRRRRDAGRGRGLVLAHRLELLTQARDRMLTVGLSADIESGESRAPRMALAGQSDVVVATVQSMRGRRLESWHPDSFATIVVDEAHHATSASYRAVLDYFGSAKVLGVTATPDRGDGVAVGHLFGAEPCYAMGIREGIEGGYLAPIRAIAVDTPSIDLSSVRVTKQEHGRDLSSDDLGKQMRAEKVLHEIAAPFAKLHDGRQSLIFVPSVDVAHALASVLTPYLGADVVRALDGESPKDERAEVLGAFKRRKLRVLINCALFTEGFDAPETACVAICRPTKSRALYAQMVGRGTRIAPGKPDLLLLDFAPQNERHDLVAPIDLMAGDDMDAADLAEARAAMNGEDVLKVLGASEEAAKKRAAAQRMDRERARLVADARYRTRARDPFGELGISGEVGGRGPRATERQLEALKAIGFDLAKTPSRGEAGRLLDEVTRRRQRGLCSLKQMRQLGRFGLRTDLTFAEAGEAMTALKSNGWRMTAAVAERWSE